MTTGNLSNSCLATMQHLIFIKDNISYVNLHFIIITYIFFSQSMHQAADPAHAGISSLLPPPVTPGQPMPNPAITKLAL